MLLQMFIHANLGIHHCGAYTFKTFCHKMLIHTDSFICPNDTFKCPGLYCVKLRYVCDGLWDCPSGHEENNCTSSSPGLYKCKDTLIHVALENICDNVTDCPLSDDQIFCDIRYVTCPENCSCLLYALLRNLLAEKDLNDEGMMQE